MALGLTYFSVGLAYTPLVFKGFAEGEKARSDSVAAIASDSLDSDSLDIAEEVLAEQIEEDSVMAAEDSSAVVKQASVGGLGLALALGATFLFIFVLPVMVVVGSLPSGLISALIIGIGMRQAWQMTGGQGVSITGPYKVGGEPPPAEPAPSA
jgi:hypothetical protein